jgi:hypothetical protein
MNRKIFFLIFICLLYFDIRVCPAQVDDACLWTSVNIEKKITSKFSATLTEELRFNENISELGTAFTEIGANYKFYKFFSFGLSYRYIQSKNLDDSYSLRHRYNIDLAFKYKVEKVLASLRERFQTQYTDVNASENGKVPDRYLRSKLILKYDLEKKYTPFISCELFLQLTNPEGNELDKERFAGGFSYEFNKYTAVDLFYMINKEIHANNPLTEYITGVEFNYSF